MMQPPLLELLDPQNLQLLAGLPPYDEAQVFAQSAALRKLGVSAELTATLLTQSRLRAKAQAKFGPLAGQLLFTANGLEQATRPVVAAHHAQRCLAAGCHRIADITCGIGTDSIALAQAGLIVLAVEIDPETAAIAQYNSTSFRDSAIPGPQGRRMTAGGAGLPRSSEQRRISAQGPIEVVCGDGLAVARARADELDGIYADPARRERQAGAKRQQIFDPDAYLPPLGEVLAMREVIPAVGVKVAPVIPHDAVPTDCEAQWVSVDGDVVECGLWFGPLAPNGPGKTALLIRTGHDGAAVSRLVTAATAANNQIEVGPVGEFLFEPDGAVIRAGLLGVAATELGAHQLDPSIAYLTGNRSPAAGGPVPIATAYRVLDVMPLNIKQLKVYLKARSVGRVTIKKRGTAVTPEQLRPQLALKGPNEATIVLTRIADKHSIIIVEPIPNGEILRVRAE